MNLNLVVAVLQGLAIGILAATIFSCAALGLLHLIERGSDK